MRKFHCLICLILCVCFLCGSCASAEEKSLQKIAAELINDLHELANDEAYLEATASSISYYKPYFASIAEADLTDMKSIVSVKIPGTGLLMLITGSAKMSRPGREKALQSIYRFGTIINARYGSDALAASAILTFSRTYLAPEFFSNCCWLVDCGDAIVCVSFIETGDGIITATAEPLFLSEGKTMDDLKKEIRSSIPIALFIPVKPEM